jgi:hypothetical protein
MGGVISSPIKSVLSAVSGAKPSAPQVDAPKPQPISSPTQAEVDQGEASRLIKAKSFEVSDEDQRQINIIEANMKRLYNDTQKLF